MLNNQKHNMNTFQSFGVLVWMPRHKNVLCGPLTSFIVKKAHCLRMSQPWSRMGPWMNMCLSWCRPFKTVVSNVLGVTLNWFGNR